MEKNEEAQRERIVGTGITLSTGDRSNTVLYLVIIKVIKKEMYGDSSPASQSSNSL
jgi:hypothetical protein